MKKLLISLLLFMLFPILTYAEVDYDITDYYIESHILENGDIKVQELFVLDGTFNGYERDLVYRNSSLSLTGESIDFSNDAIYNASGIKDVSVKAKYVDDVNFDTMQDNDFTIFNGTDYASNGSKGLYIKSLLNGGERYRMYYASNNNRVAFYLTYTITEAVVIHDDVAELYWTFIGNDYADNIENLNINVYLPGSDNSDNFRIWAHGDLTGEIDYLQENSSKVGATAHIDNVNAYEPVDVRMTFDKSLIIDETNLDHSNITALNKIIEVETERANEANALRAELRMKYGIVIAFGIIYIISFIVMVIYVIKKYAITKKSDFSYEYNREFIDDYNVEVVDYLLHKNNISSNAMSASILNMIYKKNIKAEEILNSKKNNQEYKFILLNEENLNEAEKKLVDFLFRKIGNVEESGNYSFTTIDLKAYASETHTYSTFINTYTNWLRQVRKDGESEGFYENVGKARWIAFIWFILALILFSITSFMLDGNSPLAILYVIALAFFIYTLFIKKKTAKGSLHYDKWMAFKRFLEDFGTFKEKELPEIVLWERYLVYAVVFGIADKVEKAMNVKIKEFELNTGNSYPNIYIYHNICHSVNHSVDNAVRTSYSKQAASRSSSGSGSGGGFSSGGGFGGGGGGGRGF